MLPFEELASLLIFIPTNVKEEDTGDIVWSAADIIPLSLKTHLLRSLVLQSQRWIGHLFQGQRIRGSAGAGTYFRQTSSNPSDVQENLA